MKLVTKIATGILLGIGLPITLLAVTDIANPNATNKEGSVAALFLFGLPPTAVGSWLIWEGYGQRQRGMRDRLRTTFFRLLQEGNGHVTVLRFAMETGLEGEAARAYLDERAKEFNATFNVTEEGKLTYYFDLEGPTPITFSAATTPASLSAATETYDVVLEAVPNNRQRQVVKAIHDLAGLEWQQAKALVKQLPEPIVIKRGISRSTAEQWRDQLEAAGATVLIILN